MTRLQRSSARRSKQLRQRKSNWQLEAGPQRPQRWRPQQPWSGAAQAGTSVQKEGSPQAAAEHIAPKGQGQRQEGQEQAPMVTSALTLLPTLQAALQGRDVCEKTKQRIQKMANDVTLCQTIEAVIGCYESECDRAEIRRDMADLLVSQFEKDENQVNEAMLKKYQPLWQEGGPDGDEHFEGVLPSHHRASGRRPLPRTSRPVQGKLLATHKGCEIREWFDGWDAVTVEFYVGKGDGQVTCSIFQESYKDSLDPVAVGRAIDGRSLYVLPSEVGMAEELIERFGIAGQQDVMLEQGCEDMLKATLKNCASVSLTEVVLKALLVRRPGHLGNMLRLLPCCARKHFRQVPV